MQPGSVEFFNPIQDGVFLWIAEQGGSPTLYLLSYHISDGVTKYK